MGNLTRKASELIREAYGKWLNIDPHNAIEVGDYGEIEPETGRFILLGNIYKSPEVKAVIPDILDHGAVMGEITEMQKMKSKEVVHWSFDIDPKLSVADVIDGTVRLHFEVKTGQRGAYFLAKNCRADHLPTGPLLNKLSEVKELAETYLVTERTICYGYNFGITSVGWSGTGIGASTPPLVGAPVTTGGDADPIFWPNATVDWSVRGDEEDFTFVTTMALRFMHPEKKKKLLGLFPYPNVPRVVYNNRLIRTARQGASLNADVAPSFTPQISDVSLDTPNTAKSDSNHHPVIGLSDVRALSGNVDDPSTVRTDDDMVSNTTLFESDDCLTSILQSLSALRVPKACLNIVEEHSGWLGNGGYGDVRSARLDDGSLTGRAVAVKSIRPVGGPEVRCRTVVRFARELSIWALVKHPNILPLLGFYLAPDYNEAWLVSELCQNGNIMEYIARTKPPEAERLSLAQDTIEGLKCLHEHPTPIYHGDLKATNILITKEKRAVLCDFGLAKIMDISSGLTTSTSVRGSARWFSPEVALDESKKNLESDIWAWGCVLLEVMTGKLPFEKCRSDGHVFVQLHNQVQPAPLEELELSSSLKELLAKCWNREPKQRPSASHCCTLLRGPYTSVQ